MRLFNRNPLPLPKVSVLDLGPDDRIVVEIFERHIPTETLQEAREFFAKFAGIEPARVIIVCNATVRVLRNGDPPPPPVIIPPQKESRGI